MRDNSKGHRVAVGTEILDPESGEGAIPPKGSGLGQVREQIEVVGCTIAAIPEVIGVATVAVVFEVPKAVGLIESDFIILMGAIGKQALVIAISQLVDVPD